MHSGDSIECCIKAVLAIRRILADKPYDLLIEWADEVSEDIQQQGSGPPSTFGNDPKCV